MDDGYFAFDRLITKTFVKAVYFIGFVLLTLGGIALAIWAGLRLQEASIPRQVGWRYVAIGIGAVIVGNLLWRIFCEFWIVLFNMHARLVTIDRGFNASRHQTLRVSGVNNEELPAGPVKTDEPVEAASPATQSYDSNRPTSVLGLT